MALAASPLLCNAGPILSDSSLESGQGQSLGLNFLSVTSVGYKDDSKDKSDGLHDYDRPGHSHDSGTDHSDRGLKGPHGPPNEDHGRYSDLPGHDRWHGGDGPVQTHLGDRDGAPVPESTSTAMLLGATLIALLAFARTQKPKAARTL